MIIILFLPLPLFRVIQKEQKRKEEKTEKKERKIKGLCCIFFEEVVGVVLLCV